MKKLTVSFCTYNRAERIPDLVVALRDQVCSISFEILVVNNNSDDNTIEILDALSSKSGPVLRYVTEVEAGIVPARNRAIKECLHRDYMLFIDDDELPCPGFIHAAYDAMTNDGAQCVGGHISVDFESYRRPKWLNAEIAGFLGEIDYGTESFWIRDDSTPIWSGNVAYDMRLFRDDFSLRFDKRYNREGEGPGGGEDAMIFRSLIKRGTRIRYRPDMAVRHLVGQEKLRRRYFLRLHYLSGWRFGRYELPVYSKTWFGIPPFLVAQFLQKGFKTIQMYLTNKPGALRCAMNAFHALGRVFGYASR